MTYNKMIKQPINIHQLKKEKPKKLKRNKKRFPKKKTEPD
jgi:hypothetical protein